MKRVLIVGVSSMIGSNLAVALRRSHRVFGTWAFHRPAIDGVLTFRLPLHQSAPIRELMNDLAPEIVIYCAGESDEKKCVADPMRALRVNAEAPELFTQELMHSGASMIYLSSSKVFSGEKGDYRENDLMDNESVYGRTKMQAEQRLVVHDHVLVLRLGTVIGLGQVTQRTFLNRFLQTLVRGIEAPLIVDEFRTFYCVDEVCRALALILKGSAIPGGVFNLGGEGKHSYHSFGKKLVEVFDLNPALIKAIHGSDFSQLHKMPHNRGSDLSLNGEEFNATFGFKPVPIEQSLKTLRTSLQFGKQ